MCCAARWLRWGSTTFTPTWETIWASISGWRRRWTRNSKKNSKTARIRLPRKNSKRNLATTNQSQKLKKKALAWGLFFCLRLCERKLHTGKEWIAYKKRSRTFVLPSLLNREYYDISFGRVRKPPARNILISNSCRPMLTSCHCTAKLRNGDYLQENIPRRPSRNRPQELKFFPLFMESKQRRWK